MAFTLDRRVFISVVNKLKVGIRCGFGCFTIMEQVNTVTGFRRFPIETFYDDVKKPSKTGSEDGTYGRVLLYKCDAVPTPENLTVTTCRGSPSPS